MTTTVTNTIGSAGGRDYSDLSLYANFTTSVDCIGSDIVQVGNFYNDSEFTTGEFGSDTVLGVFGDGSGTTTDATRYLVIQAATGQSFSDNASVRTNPLIYNVSNGVGFNNTGTGGEVIQVDGTVSFKAIGIQFKSSSSTDRVIDIKNGSTDGTYTNCIFTGGSGINNNGFTGQIFNNCLFVDCTGINTGGTQTYNYCTFVNTASALLIINLGTNNYTDCAFFGTGSLSAGGGTDNFTNCMTNFTGTTGLTGGLTFANQFVSTTVDFRAKAGADLINGGTSIGGITTDISGITRNASTPTVGCWEFDSSDILMGAIVF